MNEQQIRAMISDIVCEVDYDIWKEMFNLDTAEEPEKVEDNYANLIQIVRQHLDAVMMSPEEPCRGGDTLQVCGLYDCQMSLCPLCKGHIIRGIANTKIEPDPRYGANYPPGAPGRPGTMPDGTIADQELYDNAVDPNHDMKKDDGLEWEEHESGCHHLVPKKED